MTMTTPALWHGRYEAVELLGSGAQGSVWRAHDRQHDRPVALKIRDVATESSSTAALDEARIVLGLAPHAALPLVRDDFFEEGRHVIVMDFVDGPSLRDAMDTSGGRLPYEDVVRHLDRVADALEHLHAHEPPVCHRDVKPANIVLGARGAVLVDLGLARLPMPSAAYAGTPAFVAPEIASGEDCGPPCDVYSLAVTAHLLLTGAYPEPGRRPDLEGVAPEHRDRVLAALHAGLAFDPDLRPSARDLVDALAPVATPTNLPAPLSSFVGRRAELAELSKLLEDARCVTLTGPGGIGKTRVAVEAARARLAKHPGGVWLCDLSGAGAAEAVRAALQAALGTPGTGDPVEEVAEALNDGRVLLLLDTCEHVLDAVAELAETVLARCTDLTILATSREPLRVSGEVVSPLEPLETADAVSLLDDRARSAGMRTWLPHEAATDLADALDGLPLAIELAAARLGELGLDGVRAGLSDRLELLRHGPRAHARHRTIERAVEWSWRLLEEAEQVTLRRLSVFAGTFGEDAVVAVAGPQTGRHLDRLVATSLVSPAPAAPDGTPRWRLLDTVRAYVTSKLAAAGEQATIDERHQAWIHGLVRELERRRLTGDDQPLTISIAESEHDNIAAAIYRGGSTALEITDSVWGLWCARGRRREWTSAVRQALERAPDAPPEVRAGAKHKLADELVRSSRLEEAKALLEEAFALLGDNAPDRLVGGIHNALAHIAMRSGEIDSAGELLERGLDRLGGVHAEGAASLAGNLGNIRHFQGRLEEARTIFADVIAAARARGDHERVIVQLLNLGALETRAERIAEGERHTLDALREMIETGIHLQLQGALVNLAMLWLAAAPDLGARTWGAALAHMERTGFVIGDTERAEVERDLQRARELLGPETFENLVAEGSQWTIERVLASGPQLG